MVSKCFENMEALKLAMKRHNINLDSSSLNISYHEHALFSSFFILFLKQPLVLLLISGLHIL